MTSAADRQVGFIRSDPEWRAALEACLAEGAAVANADGAAIHVAVDTASEPYDSEVHTES